MKEDFRQSRYNQRTKRRKTNTILNVLIGVVFGLIIVVSAVIFLGDNEEAVSTSDNTNSSKTTTEKDESSQAEDDAPAETDESSVEEENVDTTENKDETDVVDEEMVPEDESTAIVTEDSTDANVLKTIVNPNWKPIGTVQSGEHNATYSGVDWDEMVKAVSYATGLAENDMTIQFLGQNGPNKSKGTVFSKDKTKIYRVSIEWVDGKGWKPVQVEQLKEVQKLKE